MFWVENSQVPARASHPWREANSYQWKREESGVQWEVLAVGEGFTHLLL